MRIKELSLTDFRNIQKAGVELGEGINIFYGKNAQGKTNFLESIYMCSTGRSHRTKNDRELICFSKNEAHIRALFNRGASFENRIDIHIRSGGKKGIAVNNVPIKKSSQLLGILYTVIFSPEDLQLIKSSPSERRRFIDVELCQLSKVYCHNLQQYTKILKQRNNLLKSIQKNNALKDTLFAWDQQLVDFGRRIIKTRNGFVKTLSIRSSARHSHISGNDNEFFISYAPNVEADDFEDKLKYSFNKDIVLGSTSTGPHRDDICFYINGRDVKIYGSQGQQRTAALCAKLAEIDIIESKTSLKPVLLLDDVLSELDKTRQHMLIECINGIQTIITCTGIEDFVKSCAGKTEIFKVENGSIKKET